MEQRTRPRQAEIWSRWNIITVRRPIRGGFSFALHPFPHAATIRTTYTGPLAERTGREQAGAQHKPRSAATAQAQIEPALHFTSWPVYTTLCGSCVQSVQGMSRATTGQLRGIDNKHIIMVSSVHTHKPTAYSRAGRAKQRNPNRHINTYPKSENQIQRKKTALHTRHPNKDLVCMRSSTGLVFGVRSKYRLSYALYFIFWGMMWKVRTGENGLEKYVKSWHRLLPGFRDDTCLEFISILHNQDIYKFSHFSEGHQFIPDKYEIGFWWFC